MAEVSVRKKLISEKEQYFSEESVCEEDKRNFEAGSVSSRKIDRESSVLNNNNNNFNNNYEENNSVLVTTQKKKEGAKDEDVKKMDKSCEVCRVY